MQPFPNVKRQSHGHTVEAGVETVSSHGGFICVSVISNQVPINVGFLSFRIVRAFLVEEAKIVKKVIKSQAKGARK